MALQTEETALMQGRSGLLAVVLTHRRGCAVAAIEMQMLSESEELLSDPVVFGSRELSERLRAWLPAVGPVDPLEPDQTVQQTDTTDGRFRFGVPQPRFWEQLNSSFLAHAQKGVERLHLEPAVQTVSVGRARCAWVLADSPSAEGLWLSYRSVLAALEKTERDVAWLGCARGPIGSFTGLRIGASFCAGLQLGRSRPVFGIPTFTFAHLSELPGASPFALWDAESAEQWRAQGSEYASPVCGCELMLSLALVLCVGCDPWQNLQVGYSAEPGPVLKRRAEIGPEGHG